MIHEDLKKRLTKAIYNQDDFEKSILRVILGEISIFKGRMSVKSIEDLKCENSEYLPDEVVTPILIKIRKDLLETNTEHSLKEATLVSEYLPKIMSEKEIENALMAIILVKEGSTFKEIKTIFDTTYPGQNGQIVAKYIKQLI